MKLAQLARSPRNARSGSMLVLALLLLLALGGITASLSVLNLRLGNEHGRAREDLRAFCVAEGGLNEAYSVLLTEGFDGMGALDYPRAAGSGSYRAALIDGRDDHAVDVDHVRLRSVGSAGGEPAGVQLMVHHVPTGPYEFALFGSEGLEMHSNVQVDSFDSKDGAYPSGAEFVNDFGNVGSFEAVSIASNVDIHGDALVGPDGVFADASPGVLVSGDQEAREIGVEMPLITVPSYPTKGVLTTSGTVTIPSGNHHYTALTVGSGKLKVVGPATLVVDDLLVRTNAEFEVDATNGPVKIYATGDFELRSNSRFTTTTGRARDLEVLITSSNLVGATTIDLSSNSDFMGTIYAPAARIELASNFEVFGAVKAAFVEVASNTRVHFDEDLLYDPDAADVFERMSWRRLSPAEVEAELAGEALP
jgi:hypothetical protein